VRLGKGDWCLLSHDGKQAICPRVKSPNRMGKAGWLHDVTAEALAVIPSLSQKTYLKPSQVRAYLDRLGLPAAGPLKQHADSLKLPVDSLRYFDVRYDGASAVLVFPMWDRNKTVGCRMRRQDGRKWSLRGGRSGIFRGFPAGVSSPLIVTEGPTDGAAAVAAGFRHVVGRPNCWCGGDQIKDYLELVSGRNLPVIILSDPNEVGRDGSRELATRLPNPAIVLASRTDARTFVAAKGTDLFREVILALEHHEREWNVMFRNMRYVSVSTQSGFMDRVLQFLKRDHEQYRTGQASAVGAI
jgi:hypothetical protein